MIIDHLSPSGLSKPNGFSHVTISRPGRMIFVSGQVSRDASGKIVGLGDLTAQTDQVYVNSRIALAAAGATFKDIVKIVTYAVGLDAEKAAMIRTVRDRHLGSGPHPASTLVGVESLATPGLLIEMEVTAVSD